jgi:pyruvate,water dikinase
MATYIRWFEDLGSKDLAIVGGKNSSLGEMIKALGDKGIAVPGGFAITSDAYWAFLEADNLPDKIRAELEELKNGSKPLSQVGDSIRRLILHAQLPDALVKAIGKAYRELCLRYESHELSVAVRSSATAEDLPDASFAGQQESFLNIRGEENLLEACQRCYASLFTDRAISYRDEKGFDHMDVALSIGIQKMVRSDKGSAGVMFSIGLETGFKDVVVVNASWGLGEGVVQGLVTPDEYIVYKPLIGKGGLVPIIEKRLGDKESKIIYSMGGSKTTKTVMTSTSERISFVLNNEEIIKLANWACIIEEHYKRPMDIEWAKDGDTGELFIVQARPETVQHAKGKTEQKTYRLKQRGEILISGIAIGEAIAVGESCIIKSADEIDRFKDGAILITGMTDPDWVPIMTRASGIVTDLGGRTSHAAIVSREIGIPAIVGTGKATSTLRNGQEITMSCAEGTEGYVYRGKLDFEVADLNLDSIPETRTQVMLNIASPAVAFRWWRLPCKGIGLARMEFIINNIIKIHPMALVHFKDLKSRRVQREIEELTKGYDDKAEYFIDHLSRGIARIAASQYPYPVIVRMSDFKTNEYANLIGGRQFEPNEENPMLGFRGASRYYSDRYREAFALECWAIRRAREKIGLTNIFVMIPFCRTPLEAERVLQVLAENGLNRGEKELQVYMMCEIPSNVILADQFADYFDGFSIGSNDLTQLVLGVDRDSADLSHLFDERNEAVKKMIASVISVAHSKGRKVGICGQAPSDYPDFVDFLVDAGIDSISVNPDSVVQVIQRIAEVEKKRSVAKK